MLNQLRQGVTWTYAAIAVGALIQVGVTSVTARLLDPAAFGLVAMANVLLRLGGYLAQMGVGRALIQRPDITPGDVRAAFTSSIVLGLGVACAVGLAAPLAGAFFRTPEVVPVVRLLALTFLVNGFGATSQALLRRELRFRESGTVEVVSYAAGYGAPALLLAYAGFGVWSLVIAAIGQASVGACLSYWMTRHALRPTFQFALHKRLLGFGAKVSLISFLEFIGSTLDSVVIGRFGSAAQLGLYNRAFMLASLPTYQLNNGIAKVLFPVLSGGQSNLIEFRVALMRTTVMAVKIVLPVGVGMALAAPEMVLVVLGQQWAEAIPVFRVLSLALAINILATFPGIALEALAILRAKAFAQAAFIVALGSGLLFATLVVGFNLQLVVLLIAVAYTLRALAYFGLSISAGAYEPSARGRLLKAVIASGMMTAGFVWAGLALSRITGLSAPARLAVAITMGLIALAILFIRDLVKAIRQRGTPTLFQRQRSGV